MHPEQGSAIAATVRSTVAALEARGGWWRFCDGQAFSNRATAAGTVQRVGALSRRLVERGTLGPDALPLLCASAVLQYAPDLDSVRKELEPLGIVVAPDGHLRLDGDDDASVQRSAAVLDRAASWWTRERLGVMAAVGLEVERRGATLGLDGWATLDAVEPDAETLQDVSEAIAPYCMGSGRADFWRLSGMRLDDASWRRAEWRRLVRAARRHAAADGLTGKNEEDQ